MATETADSVRQLDAAINYQNQNSNNDSLISGLTTADYNNTFKAQERAVNVIPALDNAGAAGGASGGASGKIFVDFAQTDIYAGDSHGGQNAGSAGSAGGAGGGAAAEGHGEAGKDLPPHTSEHQSEEQTSPDIQTKKIEFRPSSEPTLQPTQFADTAKAVISKIDTEHNGEVTKAQLGKAMEDPQFKGQEAQAVAAMYKNFDGLKNLSHHEYFWNTDTINAADLDKFAGKASSKPEDLSKSDKHLVSEVFATCNTVADKGQQIDDCQSLYGTTNPLDSITPYAVRQGSIGDCYYEAAAASVANTHPEQIRDAIKDNGDGTYTVTFPGDKDRPQTVKAPTEAELGLYNHASGNGTWASVLEKAYGQYREQIEKHHTNTPQEGADGGGWSKPVIKLLTGKDADYTQTNSHDRAGMKKQLEDAFSGPDKKVVTASVDSDESLWHKVNGTDTSVSKSGFFRQHEYSVVGFTQTSHGAVVSIRNPWGGDDGTTRGNIDIPLKDFLNNFNGFTIQK